MKIISGKQFKAAQAWGAQDIADIEGASVRLHWTDKPYKWHKNDGEEVFVVLSGAVEMRFRGPKGEESVQLNEGDIFHAQNGDEHLAIPVGEARILVVEKKGSV